MKKFLSLIVILAAVVTGLDAQTLTVADDPNGVTMQDRYIPVYGFYMDAPQRSQTIYPYTMLTEMTGKYITGLTYYFYTAPNGSWGGTQTVRIGVTAATNLGNGFVTSPSDIVWTGTLSDGIANNQMHIVLDQPFLYTSGNLLIEIENPTAATWKDAYFTGQSQSEQLSYMTWLQYGSNETHAANYLPKLTFAYSSTPGCASVSNLTSTLNGNSALLAWVPSPYSTVTGYTVGYKFSTDTAFTEVTTTDTFLIINNLTPNTDIQWRVRANCGDSEQSVWKTASLHVPQVVGQLPYACGFEDEVENQQWMLQNGSYPNKWAIGEATHHGGSHALYISNDNGASNQYSNGTSSSTSTVWAYRDIYFDTTYNEYDISLDFKGMGLVDGGFMRFYLGSPATPSGLSVPGNDVQQMRTFYFIEDWQRFHFVADSTHRGLQRLYFVWNNGASVGVNPPAAIDNVTVSGVSVPAPTGLAATGVTTTSATLSWAGDAPSYTLSYRMPSDTVGTEVTVSDTFFVATGLDMSQAYLWKVKANTGNGSVWSGENRFKTMATAAQTPYNCDFEDDSESRQWQLVNGTYANRWSIGNAVNHGGEKALYVSDNNGVSYSYNTNITHIWAYRDIDFDTIYAGHRLSFDCKNHAYYSNSYHGTFRVYIGDPVEPNGGYVPAGAVQLGGDIYNQSNWSRPTFLLDSTYRGVKRLYFYWHTPGSYSRVNPPAAVDNVTIESFTCSTPDGLATLTDSTSAVLTWNPPCFGTAASYTIAYRALSDSAFTEATITDTFLLMADLVPSTRYEWKVRAHCSATDESDWSEVVPFITDPTLAQLPYFCGFEDSTENRQWRFVNLSDEGWFVGSATAATDGHSLYISNDGGVSHAVNQANSGSDVHKFWTYRDVYFSPGCADYQISFDYQGMNDPWGHFKMVIGSAGVSAPTTSSFEPDGGIFTHYISASAPSWKHFSITVDSTFQGVRRLYFHFANTHLPCVPPPAIDNLTITGNPCPRVQNLRNLDVADTFAILAWSPVGAGSYTVAYKSDDDSTYMAIQTTDTTLRIGGLAPSSSYEWKVQAHCSDTTESYWSEPLTFSTIQLLAHLPYVCDFENADENAHWATTGTAGNNRWFIGTAAQNGGASAIYISQDNGATNTFDPNSTSYAEAYRNIYFDPEYKEYLLSFDVRCQGGSMAWADMYIGSATNFENDATSIANTLHGVSDWTHYEVILDSTFAGNRRLCLIWNNYTFSSYSPGENPPAAFDNISISGVSCSKPVAPAVLAFDLHSATLSWSGGSAGAAGSYTVAYRKSTDSAFTEVTVSDTTLQLTGLQSGSHYFWKVRANCQEGETSYWCDGTGFRTFAELPYYCGFETAEENELWVSHYQPQYEFSYAIGNRWAVGGATHCTGTSAMYISDDNGLTHSYETHYGGTAWATLNLYLDPAYPEYQVSFDFKGVGEQGQDYMRVYCGDPAYASSQTYFPNNLEQIGGDLNLTEDWTSVTLTLDSTHAGYKQLYLCWTNDDSDGENPPAAVDNIMIVGSTCGIPTHMTQQIMDSTALLRWSAGVGTPASYLLAYKQADDSLFTEISTTDTFQLLTSLLPLTDYVWKVRAACGDSVYSSWSSTLGFTTTQPLKHLPYLCSFDDADENSRWMMPDGDAENRWVIGGAAGNGDNNALYISNDSGTTNAYELYSAASVWAYRDVCFDENFQAFELSFDFKGMGQNSADYMQVFVGAPAVPGGAAVPAGAVQLGGQFSYVNGWTHYAFIVDSTHVGAQRIYFLWVNDGSMGVQPPAAVDNLSVTGLTCVTPSSPTVTDMTANTVTLSWEPSALSSAASFTVSVRDATTSATAEYTTTDTFLTVSGLAPSAAYYCKVRANCSADDHSGWSSDLHVQMPAALPYVCDFEDAGERDAWQFVNGTYTNKWYVGDAVSHGGSHSLYVSNDGGATHAYSYGYHSSYVWAYRDIYFDPSDSVYALSFDMIGVGGSSFQTSAYTNVYLGPPAIPDGSSAPAGATALATGLCGMSAWTPKTYTIDHTHAGWQRLYFFWNNTGWTVSNPPAAIDNITIDGTPCNLVPSDLAAQAMDTLALLSWTLTGGADYYTIAYKSQADTAYTYFTTQDEHFSLGDLTPATPYYWKVRAHCTASDHSFWSAEATFMTPESTPRLPYACDFEDAVENSRWTILNGTFTNKWHIGSAANNGGDHSLYVSNDNGSTNAYTFNSPSQVWAYRDFYFTPGYSSYQISFDIRSFGEVYNNFAYDFVRVYLGPPATPSTAQNSYSYLTPQNATQLGDGFMNDSLWHSASFTVDSTFAGIQRLYFLWKNDASYGTNPPGAIDNIQISTSGCPMPQQLVTTNILDDAATLTWQSDADTFVVAFKASADSAFTEIVTTETSYTMTGLAPSSSYTWKVKSLCADGESSFWSMQLNYQTLAPLGRIPYTQGFEDADENSRWTIQYYYGYTNWYIGHAAYQSGDSAMYISNDNGATNSFSNSNISYCWAYRDIYFDPAYSGYEISFDYRVQGAADFAGMKVFVGPPAATVNDDTPSGAVQIGQNFYGQPNWTHFSYTADTTFQGVKRLYFLWTHNWGTGANPPAAVDNISIQGGHCGVPIHITVDSVTAHTITVHFSPSSPSDSVWEASVTPAGTPVNLSQLITITDTFYTFQNLLNNTTYDICLRAVCDNGDYSYWSQAVTQRTDCGYISSLPYSEDFDSYGSANYPWCWRKLNTASGNFPYIDLYSPGHYDHTYSTPGMLVFSAPSGTYNIAILPEIDPAIPMNELQVTFQYKTYDPADMFIVGVMSDPEDAASFIPVDTVRPDYHQVEHWAEKKVHLHNYNGNGHFIALRHEATGTASSCLDNVLVEQAGCPLPHDISVTNVNDHSADIDWTADGGETSWQVVVKLYEEPLAQAVPITVTSKPYHIDNLTFGKWYEVYVKADCGNGETSGWSMPVTFTTSCATITSLPYVEDFENYFDPWYFNEFARPRCWTFPQTSWAYPGIFFPENANIQETHYYAGSSHSLYFRSESSYETLMAVAPRLDVELHDVRASFKMHAESEYSGRLEVGVLNSSAEETSFELVRTIQAEDITNGWSEIVVDFDLTAISGTGNHLAFRYYPWSSNWYMWMDDLEINYIHPADTDSVGVATYDPDRLLHLYPNPTTGKCVVSSDEDLIGQLEVFDMYGKRLEQRFVGDYRTVIDLSPRASGIYFVRVTTGEGIVTRRVVKR